MTPLELLYAKAFAGDVEAYGKLLVAISGQIRREIKIYPRWQALTSPDDVLQSVILYAWLRGCAGFKARNCAHFIKTLCFIARRRATRPPVPDGPSKTVHDPYGGLLDSLTDPGTSPSRLLSCDEAKRLVEDCLAQLPEKYQVVLRMRYIENRTIPDAAAELELSIGGFRNRLEAAEIAFGVVYRRRVPRTTGLWGQRPEPAGTT